MSRLQRGQAMVEFCLIAFLLFFVILIGMDLFRAYEANETVASAARQAARQGAANGVPTDNPWGAFSGSCIGVTTAQNANGTGCLTDAAILSTSKTVMGDFGKNLTLKSGTSAAGCAALSVSPGAGYVCINPVANSGTTTNLDCTQVGSDPFSAGELDRQSEWTSHEFTGCYFVQVTVVYGYVPITPILRNLIGGASGVIKLQSTSTVLAEY